MIKHKYTETDTAYFIQVTYFFIEMNEIKRPIKDAQK
jgi:hypothetical protein